MKKKILITLTLALFLTSCGSARGTETTVGDTDEIPSFDSVALGAAEQKATYYREMAAKLEQELLTLKAAFYEERVMYGERIAALEAALAQDVAASEELFRYTVTDGRATVTGYSGKSSAVAVPTTLGGAPVTAIADRAFENNLNLTSLTLPEGVTNVGWFACSGCVFLQSVTLPESVERIEYGAFQNCPSGLTIICANGSYAEKYAVSYGIAVK